MVAAVVDDSEITAIYLYASTGEEIAYFKTTMEKSGYPIAALDMVYVFPALVRRDGRPIPQTNAVQQLDGKSWQRWSRHRTAENPWRPGEDCVEHHIFLVEDWFAREFSR